ncbi:MAG: hypothetical protein K8R02_04955 [Anaerohalosphaeraceae bacterium]|nr:hypothetical protein [Anaerohalosphaeraceae bacterium]
MKEKNFEMHLISNTHWDIEYLWSAKETQIRLVEMMDGLLEILDNDPDYKHFHFDSQVFPMEEYLDVRSESKERLCKHVRDGKLLIGPWYTLPDEFLASGESLIRNLLTGHKKAEELGKVMKVGYNIFSFGQISQLPQIYAGFGIDTIIFKRGINETVSEKLEFWWNSPDGTKALALRTGPGGRGNFGIYVFLPVIAESWCEGQGWEDIKGTLFNLSDNYSNDPVHHLVNPDLPFHQEKLSQAVENLKEIVLKGSTTPYLLIFDGYDGAQPYAQLSQLIKEVNKVSDIKLIHSSLPIYLDKLKKEVKDLKVLSGEMRHAGQAGYGEGGGLFPGVLSSRMPLKRINSQVEINLEKWAEPTSVFTWMLGREYPRVHLEDAWKKVLINQQHDGVTGTHIDRVYQSIMERYRQSLDIAETLTRNNLEYIASSIDDTDVKDNEALLVVFNPLPYVRTEVVQTTVDFFWDKEVNSFTIQDFNGEEIIPQKISTNEVRLIIERSFFYPLRPAGMKRIQFNFKATDIPPLGYKTFVVKPSKQKRMNSGSLVTSANTIENEFLKVKINNDGTLTITDKSNNNTFDNLHHFVDNGDVGCPLFHKPPQSDQKISSLGNPCHIALIEDNQLTATFKIEIKMLLPAEAEVRKTPYGADDGYEVTPFNRSDRCKEFTITSYVTLRKTARRLDVVTKFDNNIGDHRLQVLFPTKINAGNSCAEGQFDVLERKIKSPAVTQGRNAASETHPQHFFVDVNDGKKGLAIISQGLPEYEVINDEDKAVALTLLRCTRTASNAKNSREFEQPLAQCPGEHQMQYSIYPHSGNWEKAQVFEEAYRHNVPVRIAQVRKPKGKLPKEMSFLKIEPSSVMISAIKKSEKGNSLIVRLWNPALTDIKAKVWCYRRIETAKLVNLEEKAMDELNVKTDNSVVLEMGKKKIVSVKLVLKKEVP